MSEETHIIVDPDGVGIRGSDDLIKLPDRFPHGFVIRTKRTQTNMALHIRHRSVLAGK